MVQILGSIAAALVVATSVHATPLLKNFQARQFATSTAASAASTATSAVIPAGNTTLPPWSWTSGPKLHGVALGNWLLLERWMDQEWFDSHAPGAVDEWTFSQQLGSQAQSVLTEHWNTWITDEDIQRIAGSGFNHIRIPVGYWAFIDQPAGTPYVSMGGQLDQITRVLQSAANYGLYAILDIHGLPGSQNGEQASGHIGYNNFYQDANQAYSDATVDAAIDYILASPHRDIITALAVCNEPVFYAEDQFQTLLAYYERSYAKTSAAGIPMQFHPGHPQASITGVFQQFINGKDPELLIFENHPYPGRLQPLQQESSLLGHVCDDAEGYENFGIPVAITEWSLSTARLNDAAWDAEFWSTQLLAWDHLAGGVFWSYRVNAPPYTANMTENLTLYSFVDLANNGRIPLPAFGQNSTLYIDSLSGACNFATVPTQTFGSTVSSVSPTVTAAFTSRAGNNGRALPQITPAP